MTSSAWRQMDFCYHSYSEEYDRADTYYDGYLGNTKFHLDPKYKYTCKNDHLYRSIGKKREICFSGCTSNFTVDLGSLID